MEIINSTVVFLPILMVDATDDETAETGLTVQAFISKNGSAFTSVENGTTETGLGVYVTSLTTTESNTDGFLFLVATASGADVWRDYHQVVSRLATVSGVNYPVALNWASISGTSTAQNLSGTQIASVNYAVGVNWGSVTNPSATNNLTGTRVASVNNPVPINWASITNPTAAQNFSGSQVATIDQVADLRTTTYPELAGEPSAASTALDRLGWIYALSLNKVQMSSVTQALFTFAETATISVATHQDAGGLFTRNRWR